MKHSGGCHCGKVRFEVDIEIEKVLSCNCSICQKRGSLLAFAPIENLKAQGESEMATYTFNKHMIKHMFCKTCGILPFGKGTGRDGKVMAAINVRCLDNVDLNRFEVQNVNGKDF